MKILMLRIYYRILTFIFSFVEGPSKIKARYEMKYWKIRKIKEGVLSNSYYEYFYTAHFGLDKVFYSGKKILDIGCGPLGSLEWADMAAERIGLDPLVDSYGELGIDSHKMRYVTAGAEQIPFPDNYFDVVCSFNSLDHVDNLEQTIKEIVRVIATNGLFLLLTELNHKATHCEPMSFSWDVVERFSPHLKLMEKKHYEKSVRGIYWSIMAGVPYDHSKKSHRYGILSAKFIKL